MTNSCKSFIMNAGDGNRTRTPLAGPRILSSKPVPALSGGIGQRRFQFNSLSADPPFPIARCSQYPLDSLDKVWTK